MAALIPVWMTDVRSGAAGVLAEAAVLLAAAVALVWFSARAVRTGAGLLAGALIAEAAALAVHSGFAIYAGAWAPAGAQLLVAVPATLAGCSVGFWLRHREAGPLWPGAAVLLGLAAGAMLPSAVLPAAVTLLAGGAALGILRPRYVLLLCSLMTGASALLAVAVFFGRPGGPGNLWPVVLPVEALIVTPMAFLGGAIGFAIARAARRQNGGAAA